jgi:hypothetical protein
MGLTFMSKEDKRESTIYGWAFVAGKEIINRLEALYGEENEDKIDKKMRTYILTLRSELIPERFKRALIDILVELVPNVGIPEEIRTESRWTIDEYYRYSTAILAGLLDALNAWKREKSGKGKK